ncbi:MAG TPA: arginine--tRNA ligase [Dongiaceae bacterium]|jgi:arginyl-tRNA synthetase|nr:arginine--tRNA ligase [Dongiaceae bacterium]
MPSLSSLLSEIAGRAFAAEGLDPAFGKVTVSNRPDLAQFQCNGAMAAAKAAKQPPRAIAEKVAARLKGNPAFRDVSLAGPGFINLAVTDAFLGEQMNRLRDDARLGLPPTAKPRTVVLDYGGPNIAKPMHVGHLRAGIIGDSLRRIYKFVGDETIGDVHMGDWGLQMGMLISELEIRRPDLPYFDKGFAGPYPKESPVTLEELDAMYPKASADSKADPARMERSRQATAELQDGRPGYRALWQHFFDISVAAMKRDYGNLGVYFDLWKGEAIVHDLIAPMIEGMKKKGIVEESDGAQVIRVAEETDKREIPPLILVKSDGAFMYATTDLATIVDRVNCQNPDLSIYVVDHRQELHFVQVFRAARKAGITGKGELVHLGYGTMNGTDGKPFKTRAGNVMRLDDLFQMVTDEALKKLGEHGLGADYDEAEKIDIARKVGVSALKFADLSNNPIADYVFDLDRFSRFEGKTGPYLLYAAVRVKSLLRKAREQNDVPAAILAPEPGERDLMLALGQMPEAIQAAYDDLAPNKIADFAFGLAQTFSAYYANFHILSETNAALRHSRLAMAELVLKEIELCLELLGIATPERM